MSAAAVIIVRIQRVFAFLRERRAVSPESAIPNLRFPIRQKWYYGRLVDYGAVRRIGDKCYLDETLAQSYLREWKRRALRFTTVAVIVFCVLLLIWALM